MSRMRMGHELYLRFAKFVSDYTAHLHREETEIQPLLWRHFTDEQLVGIRTRIQQRLSPEEFARWGTMIWSSISSFETSMMLRELQHQIPPPTFREALAIAEKATGARWHAIKRELDRSVPVDR
jgi:hypothetical protein